MHLLSATVASAAEDGAAIDLDQSPGEIVVLSAADSELACLARARALLGPDFPSVRLANLLQLGHPLSVDLHVEQVVRHARVVVARLLGGRGYWDYGVEQVVAACRASGAALALLPGDARPDPVLDDLSTMPADLRQRLWRCLTHGGVENASAFLEGCALAGGHELPLPDPQPVPPAGLYRSGTPTELAALARDPRPDGPTALVVFYRALLQAADLAPVDALMEALAGQGVHPVGLYATSLKDPTTAALIADATSVLEPDIILNATGFALGDFTGAEAADPLAAADCVVLQTVFSGQSETAWQDRTAGLLPRDLAMQVALPEVDGRVLAGVVSFKSTGARDPLTQCAVARHGPLPDRIAHTAALAAAWAKLRRTPAPERRVAIVLANYPIRDGRLANGVGLDTPASCIVLLEALRDAGYGLDRVPRSGDALIEELARGVTNDLAGRPGRTIRADLPLGHYRRHYARLPEPARIAIESRWGPPEQDPHLLDDRFPLAVLPLGNIVVALQPARGYHIDPAATYHAPDLVPPHAYLALYFWLRTTFAAHAVLQLGKHGNLEWLPGKAVGLSAECWPELALGALPHLYPFIVNDPGEGTQAKRRAAAVIVDHLTPPLTRAGTWGELRELERLLDELAEAASLDPRRAAHLRREVDATAARLGLDADLALRDLDEPQRLLRIDNHLCEIKELQIRDGLHILGRSPAGAPRTDLLVALARIPRRRGEAGDASLLRALAADLELGDFDPLTTDLATSWPGPRPAVLTALTPDPWRTHGDTVERLELLAHAFVAGTSAPPAGARRTRAVLAAIEHELAPALATSGPAELAAVLAGLAGRRIAPGPSGAPTRGRPEVLPTGRNFFSVDTRAVPTPAAWQLGWCSAGLVLEHHFQTEGVWPRHVALSAWGTANMRTGGDDIAQALALMGCRPLWEPASGRVTGIEVLPLSVLSRTRVDVTFRASGFFRDAFPAQLELLDDAVRAVAALDEPSDDNPLAATARIETAARMAEGEPEPLARRRATLRIFASAPGAYGAGLQALIDEGGWQDDADLARAFTAWGAYAYGRGLAGASAEPELTATLRRTELVLHNQDNREHDLLDSDDYYQFEGGLAATVRHLSGRQPTILHNDHSRPEHPRVRTLKDELGRIVRGRATNPKWLEGVMRHGYKGAFEIAATLDYLFAFAATSGEVESHHFDQLFDAYVADERIRTFLATHNPSALREMAARFEEAIDRGLWRPSRNSTNQLLAELHPAPPRNAALRLDRRAKPVRADELQHLPSTSSNR